MFEFSIPIKGYSEGTSLNNQPTGTTCYMQNCRPVDVLESKIKLGQRPGLKKAYSQQIGGGANPIVWLGSVTRIV